MCHLNRFCFSQNIFVYPMLIFNEIYFFHKKYISLKMLMPASVKKFEWNSLFFIELYHKPFFSNTHLWLSKSDFRRWDPEYMNLWL